MQFATKYGSFPLCNLSLALLLLFVMAISRNKALQRLACFHNFTLQKLK